MDGPYLASSFQTTLKTRHLVCLPDTFVAVELWRIVEASCQAKRKIHG